MDGLGVSARVRDGTKLVADIYRPVGEGPYPVLLMRQPYGRDIASTRRPQDWSGISATTGRSAVCSANASICRTLTKMPFLPAGVSATAAVEDKVANRSLFYMEWMQTASTSLPNETPNLTLYSPVGTPAPLLGGVCPLQG